MFDRKVKHDWSLEVCRAIFRKFGRYLQNTFPNSGIIFVLEWKPAGGFHYHLFARFGERSVPTRSVHREWNKLTGSKSKKSFQMDKFVPEHKGYTMKKEKANNMRYLISLLGAKSFWGVINRKNIKRHPARTIRMTGHQFQYFINTMIDHAMAEDHEASTYKQLNCDYGTLNFFPTEVVTKAVNSIVGPIEEDEE